MLRRSSGRGGVAYACCSPSLEIGRRPPQRRRRERAEWSGWPGRVDLCGITQPSILQISSKPAQGCRRGISPYLPAPACARASIAAPSHATS